MPVIDLGRVIGPQGPQGDTGAQGIRGEQGLPGPNQVTNSTATPLTGVLVGNGSVVGVETIDEAPTANSTGFATSGGTDKAIKGRAPVYGKGVNLLRNWYFVGGGTGRGVFPVNQRGQSSYYGNYYGIDGWKGQSGLTVTPNTSYLSLSATATVVARLYQYFDASTQESLEGKTITLSILTDVGLFAATDIYNASVSNCANVGIYNASGSTLLGSFFINLGNASFNINTSETINAKAVKLELGTEQTLCHNEGTVEAPVWVLNDMPDYEYELYRCMTSTADPNDTFANKSLATEQQLAYVETGTTASRAFDVGQYFCWNGLQCRAKTAISSGDTFTLGTNCEQAPEGGFNALNNDILDRSRQMNVTVPTEKSVDIIVTGNNYAPSHGFIVVCNGNSGNVIAAWLCIGYGIRPVYHVISPLQISTNSSLSLTSTVNGKYTLTNSSESFQTYMTVAVLQESVKNSLSLSEPY